MTKVSQNIQILGNDKDFLRLAKMPRLVHDYSPVRIIDLFCGCGGITLGCALAAHDLGRGVEIPLAIDSDSAAIKCYKANFPQANTLCADIKDVLESDWRASLTSRELALQREVGRVNLIVGGPPCQGHSDLNNYTRRHDPKNRLIMFMARAALVFNPESIVIENVVGSLNDRKGVVHAVEAALREIGYQVDVGILDFAALGVPQRRRRMILVASKRSAIRVVDIQASFTTEVNSVDWAIGDIVDVSSRLLVDRIATPQLQTKKRIDYLFDNQLYELPNEQRPPCHRNKPHSYDTVYGRLRWDELAQTITRGFYCMCMGRYVHPERRRTLTGREAARLQFFPDFFDFSPAQNRTKLAAIIGNAVPPKGGYAIARAIIPNLEPTP
jgi:DNA (cytosine-5)-methyltransferase 1